MDDAAGQAALAKSARNKAAKDAAWGGLGVTLTPTGDGADLIGFFKPAKPSKYRNQKTEVDGVKFDSKREAKRWAELQLMERAGQITDLKRQVKYTLIPSQKRDDGTTERAATYTADFAYSRAGIAVVEDSKGIRTQQGIIRRKLMLMIHKITVKEV